MTDSELSRLHHRADLLFVLLVDKHHEFVLHFVFDEIGQNKLDRSSVSRLVFISKYLLSASDPSAPIKLSVAHDDVIADDRKDDENSISTNLKHPKCEVRCIRGVLTVIPFLYRQSYFLCQKSKSKRQVSKVRSH